MSDEFSMFTNLASGSATEAQQLFLQDRSNQIDYQTWKKQQSVLNQMALENRRSEAADYVEGLKAAGMSPALAAKGNFTPVAMSAPQKSTGAPQIPAINMAAMYEATIQGEIAASEVNKNNAEADLMRSQAKGQGITNERMTQEDISARSLMKTHIGELLKDESVQKNPELSAAYESMLEAANSNKFNVGTIRANQEFFKTVASGSDAALQLVKNNYEYLLTEAMQAQGVPQDQINIIKQQVAKNQVDIIKAAADTALAYSNIELNEKKAAELMSQAAKNLTEANLAYSKDAVSQWKQGDYTALAVNVATNAINAAASGAGFGAGAGVAGKIAGKGAAVIGSKLGGKVVSPTAYNAGQRLKNLKVGSSAPKGMNYDQWRKHYGVPDNSAFRGEYNRYKRDTSSGFPKSR